MRPVKEIVISFLHTFSKENGDVGSFFASIQLKIDELNASLYFLDSDNNPNDDVQGGCTKIDFRQQWQSFLFLSCNREHDDAREIIAQREELVDALISCCDVGVGNEDESLHRLSSASFLCLSYILRLRNASDDKSSSIVGSRLDALAPLLLQAIHKQPNSLNDKGDPLLSALSLVQNLMPPRCRREECHVPSVRDYILLPASSSQHSTSVAAAAHLLSSCIVESAITAGNNENVSDMTPIQKEEYNETVSLKKETVALQRIQDFRQVLENVVNFESLNGDLLESKLLCSINESLTKIYHVAPAALESQLAHSEHGKKVLNGLFSKSVEAEAKTGSRESSNHDNPKSLSRVKSLSFYSHLSDPPIEFTSEKQQTEQMDAIAISLTETDADLWSARFDALKALEQILAGGIVRHSEQQRALFLDKLRRMAITEQILDLRSQITRQACRVVTALAYELRETNNTDCASMMSHFVEKWLPALLKLSISGVRLMATQGTNCLLHLSALGGNHGYPRIVTTLCEGCVEKKVHQNHKKGCVMALTMAMRVWGVHTLEKHLSLIEKAVQEASTNRDPSVREEGRKAFWAMYSRAKFRKSAEKIMAKWDKREKKMMEQIKEETIVEWERDGRMETLVRTGVDIGAKAGSSLSSTKGGSSKGRVTLKKRIGRSALPPAAARKKQSHAAQAPATPEGDISSRRQPFSSSPRPSSHSSPKSTPSSASSSPALRLTKAGSVPVAPASPSHPRMTASSTQSSPESSQSFRSKQQLRQRPWHRTSLANRPPYHDSNAPTSPSKATAVLTDMRKYQEQQQSSPISDGSFSSSPVTPRSDKAKRISDIFPGHDKGTVTGATQGNVCQISGSDTASTTLSCEDEHPASSPPSYDPASSQNEGKDIEMHESPFSQRDFFNNEKATAAAAGDFSQEPLLLPTHPSLRTKTNLSVEKRDISKSTANPPNIPFTRNNASLSHQAEVTPTVYQSSGSSTPATPKSFESRKEAERLHLSPTTSRATPCTDPVLRYMAHPTPLSAEKVPHKKSEMLPIIMEKLAIESAPQEQFLGIQGLVQFAKEHSDDDCWVDRFGDVLDCLLRGVETGSPLSFPNKAYANGVQQPLSEQCMSNDTMYESMSLSDSVTASRHLYLQGIRALLKYVPNHFEGHINKVVEKLLEVNVHCVFSYSDDHAQ